jgi:hypothetical protein
VIDLVEVAGVDISEWGNFKGGKEKAATNPKYCYEWAFIQPNKVVVLNIWFDALDEEGGTIWCDLNERENTKWAAQLPSNDPRRKRRERLDKALQTAFIEGLPVRLILVSGKKGHSGELDASRVTKRKLDRAPWAVTAYDLDTGQCTLTRNATPIAYGTGEEPAIVATQSAKLSQIIQGIEDEIEKSAGFQPNVKIRKAVELHAMQRAEDEFRERGYNVKDVSKRKPFDLLCTKANEKKYVEVKGTQGSGVEIVLTAGEVKFIQNNMADCVLCIVKNIQVTSKNDPKTKGGSLNITEPFDLAKGYLIPFAFTFKRKQ